MVLDQHRSNRKPSGGRFKSSNKKRKEALGRSPTLTKIDVKPAKRSVRTRGGGQKIRVLRTNVANLFDPKTKKYVQAKVIQVVESQGNRHYVRANIMTKGTIIKTDKGNAKVTSRPGQDGVLNAILI